jgi:hypothetical protein
MPRHRPPLVDRAIINDRTCRFRNAWGGKSGHRRNVSFNREAAALQQELKRISQCLIRRGNEQDPRLYQAKLPLSIPTTMLHVAWIARSCLAADQNIAEGA